MQQLQQRTPETEVSLPTKTVDESLDTEDRLTDNVIENVLPARYLNKDMNGTVVETPDEMFRRVAENVATPEDDAEKWADRFYEQMSTLKFMPNSPTLMNAGTEMQQLSACFVLEPEDDMQDILSRVSQAGRVFKSGGGVGYTFSKLRPKGALVASTKGQSSGPVSFMSLFDEVCQQVKQGGTRRGAQMAIMRVDHPDVGRFITAKREEGAFANFNISIAVTDEFREAVANDDYLVLKDPTTEYDEPFASIDATYDFYHPDRDDDGASIWDHDITCTNGETLHERWADRVDWDTLLSGDTMRLPARFIWDIVVDGAWRNGEPGLFNLDETNAHHSFDVDEHPEYRMRATNPCAEQPLCDHEACNLGHVNLSLMKDDDVPTFPEYDGTVGDYFDDAIDFETLDETVETGVRFLDNVATMSDFPLDEIEDTVSRLRKIGLGVMGWAQLLYQMDIRYGSQESLELADLLMQYIDTQATRASHNLGVERGSFPAWDDSKYAEPFEYREWFRRHAHTDAHLWGSGFTMRNHKVTTVAPTGTTSTIADTSGGIEPVYNVAFQRFAGDDIGMLTTFDSYFEEALEANGYDVDEVKDAAADLMDSGDYDGPHDLPIDDDLADKFVTTSDVSPEEHTRMQRAFQAHVDSGISKTINLPYEATRGDVSDAYGLALDPDEPGDPAKGITVYRDQSRQDQVLSTQTVSDQDVEEAIELVESQGYEVEEAE